MSQHKNSQALHHRLIRWRWISPLAVLGLAGLHQLILSGLQGWVLPDAVPVLSVALYGLSGSLVIWLALGWLAAQMSRQAQTEADLRVAHQSLAENHRQLLAVHDIGREIASASDLQKVLELASRAPTHLAGAKGSTVITFDAERDRLKLDMAWGLSDEYLAMLRRRMEAGLPTGRCRNCHLLAARVDSDCILFGGMEELARRDGIASLVCLPLTRDSKCEGFINAYFPSPDGPPEEQIRLLNIVATEIASALDRVRLRTNQTATLYVAEHLTQTEENLDDLLGQVLDITLAGWGVTRGAIGLYDQTEAAWHHWTQRNLSDQPAHPNYQLALYLAEEVRKKGQPLLIADLAGYPISGAGLSSVAVAPLLTGDELLGALLLASPQVDFFQPQQSPLFATIAHQATLAIRNAQLHCQVQHMAILEERYRLSREIHDGLAQTLGSLGWHLDHLRTLLEHQDWDELALALESGQQLVRAAYQDVREAIDGLRWQREPTGSLVSALQEYVADFEERTDTRVTLETSLKPILISPETELQLLRIVQEALTNVRKHARAKNIWIQLQQPEEDNNLSLTIADDGQGFDPAFPRRRGHLGLTSMRERAESQNGNLSLVTGPQQGTRITVTLPLDKKLRNQSIEVNVDPSANCR
jgi:signal transduction histidine kinase